MTSVRQTEASRSDVSQARLAALVLSSGDAIIGETLDGIITDWNPAAERLYGYAAEEVIGQNLTMVIPPDRMAETEALLARVHQGESIEGIETVRIRKDGREIDVALTVSPVWDEAGPNHRHVGHRPRYLRPQGQCSGPGRQRTALSHGVYERSDWHDARRTRRADPPGQRCLLRHAWL